MNIITSTYSPDDTYFTTGAVEPDLDAEGLIIYTGYGSRRGWGTPGVTSTVVVNADDFAAIHVGFHHKHGGGQFWRYYMSTATGTVQVTWPQLQDDQRQMVLDAYPTKAPSWAKVPGKLRSQRATAKSMARRAYKLVEVDQDGRLWSLFDGDIEYVIGKRLVEAARPNHRGGFYSHPTADQVRALWEQGALVPEACYDDAKRLALIEVEIAGTIIEYANGKLASTYLTPLAVLETFDYTPAAVAA